MSLQYVEDYVEFLHGSLSADNIPTALRSYQSPASPIKLASYDRSPIASMGSFCQKARTNKLSECLTDRQLTLVRTIISKYRRQLSENGITIPDDVNEIPLRHQLRYLDRTQEIVADLDKKEFKLKFPYSPQKISALHAYATTYSAGRTEWNNTSRSWTFDLTEGNIKQVLELFNNEDLKIDDNIVDVVEAVMRAHPGELPLVEYENNQLVLKNCHNDLHDYVITNNIELNDLSQVAKTVSHIACLDINFHDSTVQYLIDRFGNDVARIICDRKVIMPSGNQPTGPWYDTLLAANHALSDLNWVTYLTWWSDKTDWTKFKNITEIKPAKKNYSSINPELVEVLENKDTVIMLDSVVGGEAIKNYIEHKALKVIYISDIGST